MQRDAQVAIFSLEMSKESLLMRFLASQARVDAHKFRTGPFVARRLAADDARRWRNCRTRRLWIDDSGSATVTEIGAKARRNEARPRAVPGGGGLLAADRRTRPILESQRRSVQHHARAKGLAKELKVPVLVLSQLTRAPEREERSAAACRPARIGRHRAGRRRGDVHSPAKLCSRRRARSPTKSARRPT